MTIFSAFLNNTPIVAMMIPVIESWVVQCKIAGVTFNGEYIYFKAYFKKKENGGVKES